MWQLTLSPAARSTNAWILPAPSPSCSPLPPALLSLLLSSPPAPQALHCTTHHPRQHAPAAPASIATLTLNYLLLPSLSAPSAQQLSTPQHCNLSSQQLQSLTLCYVPLSTALSLSPSTPAVRHPPPRHPAHFGQGGPGRAPPRSCGPGARSEADLGSALERVVSLAPCQCDTAPRSGTASPATQQATPPQAPQARQQQQAPPPTAASTAPQARRQQQAQHRKHAYYRILSHHDDDSLKSISSSARPLLPKPTIALLSCVCCVSDCCVCGGAPSV